MSSSPTFSRLGSPGRLFLVVAEPAPASLAPFPGHYPLQRWPSVSARSYLPTPLPGELSGTAPDSGGEDALADALQRDHLRGVALDVYVGEFEHAPPAGLWSDPKVLITPHISGASDQDRHGAIDLFCGNLRAYLDGKPLRNVIDWDRGY